MDAKPAVRGVIAWKMELRAVKNPQLLPVLDANGSFFIIISGSIVFLQECVNFAETACFGTFLMELEMRGTFLNEQNATCAFKKLN